MLLILLCILLWFWFARIELFLIRPVLCRVTVCDWVHWVWCRVFCALKRIATINLYVLKRNKHELTTLELINLYFFLLQNLCWILLTQWGLCCFINSTVAPAESDFSASALFPRSNYSALQFAAINQSRWLSSLTRPSQFRPTSLKRHNNNSSSRRSLHSPGSMTQTSPAALSWDFSLRTPPMTWRGSAEVNTKQATVEGEKDEHLRLTFGSQYTRVRE